MRRLFIIYAIMVAISSYAQDIIITKKAQKIDAKILEASASEIKYKKMIILTVQYIHFILTR